MSSRHPESQSLLPALGAADSPSVTKHPRSHAAAATTATATATAAVTANSHPLAVGPETNAAQSFKLQNSRITVNNSTIQPPRLSTQNGTASGPTTAHVQSTPPPTSDSYQDRPKSVSPFPPTVNLPSGGSTPQRVDSGFEDHLVQKPTSTGFGHPFHIQTDTYLSPASTLSPIVDTPAASSTTDSDRDASFPLSHKSSAPNLRPVSRTPSFKSAAFSRGLGSAASSRVPSPIITAMGDVTPLPSPLLSGDSPGPWKRLHARHPSRDASQPLPTIMAESVLVTSNGESIASALAHQSKRKSLANSANASGDDCPGNSDKEVSKAKIHTRNRSISEYHPDPPNVPKRMVAVSGSRPNNSNSAPMRREPHLSEARGLTPVEKPPSPPPSESSVTESNGPTKPNRHYEYFEAKGRKDNKLRRWRAVKTLGQGTFSRVMLATTCIHPSEEEIEAEDSQMETGLLTPERPSSLDRKSLVAVKICEHGPKGGASEDRVEMSLKRELEIMQSIRHPSLVDLKAWNIEPSRAILVLSYCPGGDLFDVATAHRELLVPSLLRRIFAEMVGAVRYLHECHIVHRDIKLENVLVNLTPQELSDRSIDWQTYPYSITTLTDLGLSRRVTDDEKLSTRCGSEDYAAPEVIMGLEYDGFATDAWSLGVLLYALLESRLPFDPPPGMSEALRMRSRTSHRIARIEWQWIKYAGDDGDHEGDIKKFEEVGMLGAMEITEGLLKRSRSRWPLEKVAALDWVKSGIVVEGGIKYREEDDGEVVL